jgi:hypothetical protein
LLQLSSNFFESLLMCSLAITRKVSAKDSRRHLSQPVDFVFGKMV